MRFFVTSCLLNIKRFVLSKQFFVILLSITVIILSSVFLIKEKVQDFQINIGVVYDENIKFQKDLYDTLSLNEKINLIKFEDENKMKNSVLSGKIEGGYVFKDFSLYESDFKDIVTLYKTPYTTVDGFVNELLYASLIKNLAPYISSKYLQEQNVNKSLDEINKEIKTYYDNDIFVKAVFVNPNETQGLEVKKPLFDKKYILHGILALFLFLNAFFNCLVLMKGEKINSKLSNRLLFIYKLSQSFTIFITSFVLGAIYLIFIKLFYVGNITNLFYEIRGLLCYCFCLSAIAYFLILIFKDAKILYANIGFIVFSVIIFGSILCDLTTISPVFKFISPIFITHHYVQAVIENDNILYYVTLTMICLMAVSFGLIKKRLKRF